MKPKKQSKSKRPIKTITPVERDQLISLLITAAPHVAILEEITSAALRITKEKAQTHTINAIVGVSGLDNVDALLKRLKITVS